MESTAKMTIRQSSKKVRFVLDEIRNSNINDALALLPGFTGIHPDQPSEKVQGALHIIYELEQILLKITGMSAATLQLSAGSQGEFAGIRIMRKYHEKNGENRKYIIIPETAHGTNPSSVSLGGFEPRGWGVQRVGGNIFIFKKALDLNGSSGNTVPESSPDAIWVAEQVVTIASV